MHGWDCNCAECLDIQWSISEEYADEEWTADDDQAAREDADEEFMKEKRLVWVRRRIA